MRVLLSVLGMLGPSHVGATPSLQDERPLTYNELWAAHSYEEGVANRILADYHGTHQVGAGLQILTSLGCSFIQQPGLSLLGLGLRYNLDVINSRFDVTVAHESWSAWGASENRAVAMWTLRPIDDLQLSVGAGYRASQYGGLDVRHAASWDGGAAEFNAVYRVQWRFLRLRNVEAAALVWNYDRMRLYTPDNIHFSLLVDVQIATAWRLIGMVSAGISGVSGAILAWSQNSVALGLAYEVF